MNYSPYEKTDLFRFIDGFSLNSGKKYFSALNPQQISSLKTSTRKGLEDAIALVLGPEREKAKSIYLIDISDSGIDKTLRDSVQSRLASLDFMNGTTEKYSLDVSRAYKKFLENNQNIFKVRFGL